ncbi:MAG: YfcE family phosphodiesterase [Desulfobacterales bacterium]
MKILVISDIHGNAEALAAVLNKEQDADATVFLGDALLTGSQPNETISLMKNLSGILVTGPHDLDLLEPDRFAQWPDNFKAWTNWIIEILTPESASFLKSLKQEGEYTLGELRMYLTHGELAGKVRHVLPDATDNHMASLAAGNDSPMVLFGHSHIQFTREINGQQFINPGSIGQNRCGHVLACYGLIEDGVYRACQVEYDPAPWVEALEGIEALDPFPDFRNWVKQGLLTGYGVGEQEPWTRFSQEGYF